MAQEGLEFSPGIHILCQLVFVIELQQHGETGAGVDDSTVFEAKLFKKKYLPEMKDGAVFVDVAIDQGGCGESSHVTTHDDPVYTEEGVVHYCVGNMPGAVPRTSTIALTNATLKYGLMIAKDGLEEAAKKSAAVAAGVNCYLGKLTNKNVADAHGYACSALEELI